jgi:arabinose-5-phosphate isomerase
VALALGDALASALMVARGFSEQDFVRYHPGGQLGRNLTMQVADVMHRGKEVAWICPWAPIKEVVIALTEKPLGAACVVDEDYELLGLITDGDIRRALQMHDDIRGLTAEDIMTRQPVIVYPAASLKEAAHIMEDRPSQLSVLPVLEYGRRNCLGLIRIHDIYQLNNGR